MSTKPAPHRGLGIALRITLLSWLVTIMTLAIFVMVIIPQQKRTFQENLKSKAHGVAVSLRDVAAGAAVNEDFSSVVDHCKEMLKGDPMLEYLVITKNDGFSLIHDRAGWRSETKAADVWRPEKRQPVSGIGTVPLFNRRVFHYSQPFDYSGIQWGWIHVGLSLATYDRSVAMVYSRTGILGIVCILLSLVASGVYAKRMVRPILNLRATVTKVTHGDLSARASIDRGDELGSLAASVNSMTESLLRRDQILQSVRFAAQQFLSTPEWERVTNCVLERVGRAATASRIRVFQHQLGGEGTYIVRQEFEWLAAGQPASNDSAARSPLTVRACDVAAWIETLRAGDAITVCFRDLHDAQRRVFERVPFESALIIPIMVENSWWGALTVATCDAEREWTEAEQDSLRAVADMLGAAIVRHRVQRALMEAKATLEQRVQERTRELEEQVDAKRRSEEDKETILATAQMGIMIVERDSHRICYLNTAAQKLVGRTQESVFGEPCRGLICPVDEGKCPVTDLHQTVSQAECILLDGQGNRVPILKSVAPITYGGRPCLLESFIDLTERKRAEQVVENLNKELLVASRQAGMAEVATGVLHNVGNVLNSVNVSTTLIREKLRGSEVASLVRLGSILKQHEADLPAFFTSDPKGKLVPRFVIQLADHLDEEHRLLEQEQDQLIRNIEHIKETVAMQQNYARVSGILEPVAIASLMDDALQINEAGFARHGVQVIRQYSNVPQVVTDRHKILQILINLVHNAKYALGESGRRDKRLTVGIGMNGNNRLKVTVSDNGIGIPRENLTRIFSHGFSTRKGGHGFGLHSGANAAKEMGGQISVHSEGLGQGATFTLEIPLAPSNKEKD